MRLSVGVLALVCVGTAAFAQNRLGGLLGGAAALKGLNPETVTNLQDAYNGESNASATYAAFAQKAAEEGYTSVEALFKAASASEAVHAKRFGDTLTAGAAEPKATVKKPDVLTTAENLKAAIAGETKEFQDIYPKAAEAAAKRGDLTAAKAFKDALAAEAKHARFFTEAAANLDSWKDAGKTFLLCKTCGYTTSGDDTLKTCPLCGVARGDFEVFK